MHEVKTVSDKFMDFVEYVIKHAPVMRAHKAFGEQMIDIELEIKSVENSYLRVLDAANGRGMVSEMKDMAEAAVLVCGLYDEIDKLKPKTNTLSENDCPYCKGTGKGKMNGVEVGCIMCVKTGKK